ncbi:MAG: hypothetical protein CM15mV19_0420 [uncultured marine virus]|nr:MAG: hypothetical protein CM15mV19_0420 [uncultured marine virus]
MEATAVGVRGRTRKFWGVVDLWEKNNNVIYKNQPFLHGKKTQRGNRPNLNLMSTEIVLTFKKVIRSVEMSPDTIVVLLDDMHERVQEVPNINPKNNKVIGT